MSILLFLSGIIALAAIYGMLCLALNIDSGLLGLWNLGVVGFMAVGAYAYTLVTLDQPGTLGLGLPMWLGFIIAGALAGLVAFLIGLPSLRLKREHLLITTFAFAEVIRQIIVNEIWLTNGNLGFYNIPKPFSSYFTGPHYIIFFAIFALVMLGIFYWLAQQWAYSPLGRLMRAIRENELVAQSIGKDLFRNKLKIFVLTSAFVGLTGAVYVWYSSIIVPNMFTSTVTFTVWTALIIGGIGNNKGAVLGAFILIFAQEMTRFFQISAELSVVLSSMRWVVMGILLIIVLRFRPQGILPEKVPPIESRLQIFTERKEGVSHTAGK